MVSLLSPSRFIDRLDLRCDSCGVCLPLVPDDNYYLKCSCGHVYDCKPRSFIRPPLPPTHKTISRLNHDGRLIRRVVPLTDSDKQLSLFGGAF